MSMIRVILFHFRGLEIWELFVAAAPSRKGELSLVNNLNSHFEAQLMDICHHPILSWDTH